MGIIERFGNRVSQLAQTDSDKARRLLLAGWRAKRLQIQYFSNTLSKADRMVGTQVMRAMTACLARPEKNVTVSLFTPCELLLIQGLHPYSCEGFSSYLSGSMAEQGFLQKAEESGIPSTLCSYHKVFLGAAETGLMPRPKFILSTSLACDANQLTFRALSEFYGVPWFSVDVPYEKSSAAVDYVAGQLRQMGEFIARQTGIPVDGTRLIQAVQRSQRTLTGYGTFLRKRAGRQILSDLTTELYVTAAFHFLLGSRESEAYVQQLLRQAETAPPATGKQLLWVHTTPYWVPPLRQLLNHSPRVQLAACDMNYEGIVDADPARPYEAMAKRLVYSSFNGPISHRIDRAIATARQVKAHGAVWFCHWGCKHTLGGAQLGKTKLEEAGFPTLILDGDSCDRGFGGEGQSVTRMEAFLELLEGMP